MLNIAEIGNFFENVLIISLLIIVLVFVHEFGHFLVAKLFGMYVREFSIGMGPILFSFKKKETQYSIRAFPVGGYVDILGENCEEEIPEESIKKDKKSSKSQNIAKKEKIEQEDNVLLCNTDELKNPRSFINKPVWQRILVVLAGVTMNFILSACLFYLLLNKNDFRVDFANDGYDYEPVFGILEKEYYSNLSYGNILEDSNAKKAEIPEEGYIIKVNETDIVKYSDLETVFLENKSKTVSLEICNKSILLETWVKRQVEEGIFSQDDELVKEITDTELKCGNYEVEVSAEGKIGVGINTSNSLNYLNYNSKKIFSGFFHSINVIDYTFFIVPKFVSSYLAEKDYESIAVQTVSSPIAIYFVVNELKESGFEPIFQMGAIMSLSLALVNIMPIPALDGGRIMLLFIEMIFRKPLNRKIESLIIRISFYLLMLFMVVVVLKDIIFIKVLQNLFK